MRRDEQSIEAGQIVKAQAEDEPQDMTEKPDSQYRLLFERNPHPSWVFDLETLTFLAVNEAAVRHYGYSREEFERMTVKDLHPSEDEPRLMESLRRIECESDSFEAGIWRHRKRNGGIISAELFTSKVLFRGRCARLVVAMDVTERKAVEEQLKIYRAMFVFSNDGIAVIDRNGYYLEQNTAHQQMIGYADKELVDRTPAIHLGEETFCHIAEELSRTGKFRGEVISRRKTGEKVVLDLSAFAVLNEAGQVAAYVGIKRDITERKRQEEERERLVRQLKVERSRLEKTQADLQEKIMDLEQFEQAVVGRELKMIAMEKELERLREELKRLKSQ